jgi:hypothetical protein
MQSKSTDTKTCKRCAKTLVGEDAQIDAGITNCLYCDAEVCGDCTSLMSQDLVSDDYGSVCFQCVDAFIQSVEQKNALAGEQDSKCLGRHVLQGTIENYSDGGGGSGSEPESYMLVGITGDISKFVSDDYTEAPEDRCHLEPHTAWKHLLGKQIKISCRLGAVRKQRESKRGNEYWVNEPLLSKVKVIQILGEAHA